MENEKLIFQDNLFLPFILDDFYPLLVSIYSAIG